jgi:hypothetical protein
MLATANRKLSACRLQGFKLQSCPQLRRSRRVIVKARAILSLQPRTSGTCSRTEVSEPRPDSSQNPPSTPEANSASPDAIARYQHKATDNQGLSTLKSDSWGPQRLLHLLGAAIVLGVACAGEADWQSFCWVAATSYTHLGCCSHGWHEKASSCHHLLPHAGATVIHHPCVHLPAACVLQSCHWPASWHVCSWSVLLH